MIDANGNATATAFKYDALGREIERRNAPGDVWSFAYDSRDNMVLTTDAKNQTIEKTYDAMSRLTRMLLIRADGSTGDDQTFAYDAMGQKTLAYDFDSSLAWSYDGANRVVAAAVHGGVGNAQSQAVLTNSWNAVGERTGLSDSEGGVNWYDHDGDGNLTRVTTAAGDTIDLGYDPAGRLTRIANPNAVETHVLYDAATGRQAILTSGIFATIYRASQDIASFWEPAMSIRKRTWKSGGVTKSAYVVDYKDQDGKRRLRTFATKKEAVEFRDKTGIEVRAGLHVPDSASVTVSEAAALWIKAKEDEGNSDLAEALDETTLRQYRQHINLHINPTIGGMKLSRLTAPDVNNFVAEFRAANSLAMTRVVLTGLKALISYAVAAGKVAHNVAREVKSPKANKRTRKKMKAGRDFPDKAEMTAMLDAAKASDRRRAYPLMLTAAHTGLHISELLGLRWTSVDFDAAEIAVVERLDRFGNLGNPKSEDSARTVPLPPTLLGALKAWRLACPAGELVFPNGNGNGECQGNVWRRELLPVQEQSGVASDGKVKYGLHSFRHFYCSMLIDGGATPKRVQNLMGHSTLAMTMDKYGHLFPDDKLAGQVGAIFG